MRYARCAVLGMGVCLLLGTFAAAQLPPSSSAPKPGQTAPDFTLPDSTGKPVVLSKIIAEMPAQNPQGAWILLIFYRGYW